MFESRQKFVPGWAAVQDGPRVRPLLILPNKLDKMSVGALRRSWGGSLKAVRSEYDHKR
jgi:hypothetical protein